MNERTPLATLCSILSRRGAEQPERIAYTFLKDGEDESVSLAYGELDRRARCIAAELQRHGAPGPRALLLFPAGLDYIAAFFGCLYAGAVAVTAYPPRARRRRDDAGLARIQAMAQDAQAEIALTTTKVFEIIEPWLADEPRMRALRWILVDAVAAEAEDWRVHQPAPEDLAFLQYTSGSTSSPKGVMVSHGNLMHNQRIAHGLGTSERSVIVGWLPLFHDMGLISLMLHGVYVGAPYVFMAPAAFVQRPVRWLRAISRHRGTGTGGPNFAYELCLTRIRPEDRAGLDLSSLEVAYSGSEPVRADTLERFAREFAPFGLRPEALRPAYGLAEATLCVTLSHSPIPPRIEAFRTAALEDHRAERAGDQAPGARRLVGCGSSGAADQDVLIVDPEARRALPAGGIGEIWVKGPSVAQGYWRRRAATERTFRARLRDTGEGPFLRTGDLGFFDGGQLFVTGRLKDVMVCRGRNLHPQDVEQTAHASDPALAAGASAAFSVEVEGEERVVIVQEAPAALTESAREGLVASLRRAVAAGQDVSLYAVVLIRPGSLPRTTSGKVRRRASRAAFLESRLEALHTWREPSAPAPSIEAPPPPVGATAEAIEHWLLGRVARLAGVRPRDVDPRVPLSQLGLDSVALVSLTGEAEEFFPGRLSPTDVYEHPTLRAFARFLAGETEAARKPDARRGMADAEPIAVVGMACRFPGAPDLEAFWSLLRDGRDAVTEIPPTRAHLRRYFDADPARPGRTYSRWGGFLDRIDGFDPLFFGISPREAAYVDPQQRLLLELAWEALEDAGQPPSALAGTRSGVFVGLSTNDYGSLHFADPDRIDTYSNTGASPAVAANRISYCLDLQGPSLAVDTACSSSLVAVHLACQSLRRGESALALAGGANVLLSPGPTIGASKLFALAPDGRCRTFAASASGYVRSEGAGMVALKLLSRALADGDPIHAVIRGSAVSQDGQSNGLTAPNVGAQVRVLQLAYEDAGVPPASVGYVEAHGTGTPLGDPVEARALGAVVGGGRAAHDACRVGSVKSNIGHLEAAAGIAGLIKACLVLERGEIPQSLHFDAPNPEIDFSALGLAVAETRLPWRHEGPPRAGVSSFGFGGTNAHVVLEASPERTRSAASAPPDSAVLVPLSARSREALSALGASWRSTVAAGDGPPLDALAYTAGVRRSHHDHRLAIVARTKADLADALAAFAAGADRPSLHVARSRRPSGRRRKVVFVFPGQGSQWPGMGRDLLGASAPFREAIRRCDTAMRSDLGWSLYDRLAAGGDAADFEAVDVVQPLIFAVQIGLAAVWRSLGLEPAAVVGHSMGEIAAAQVAGILSLEDAARVACRRSRLVKSASGRGAMAAVELSMEDARVAMNGSADLLSVAASNGPRSTVLSGEPEALEAMLKSLEERGVFCRRIRVDYASHSPQMDALGPALLRELGELTPRAGTVPFYSTVTGCAENGTHLDASYWQRNLREPVLLSQAMACLASAGFDAVVEVSPHPILIGPLDDCLRQAGTDGVLVPSLRREDPASESLLASLAELYVGGVDLDFARLHPEGGQCVPLPLYVWQRQRCWLEGLEASLEHAAVAVAGTGGHPLLGPGVDSSLAPGQRFWPIDYRGSAARFAQDHQVHGTAVLPAAAYLDLALAAAADTFGPAEHFDVEGVRFLDAFTLEGEPRRLQLALERSGPNVATFRVSSASEGTSAWVTHAEGRVRRSAAGGPVERPHPSDLRARCASVQARPDFYGALAGRGLEYGAAFQGVETVWRGDGEAVAHLRLPAEVISQVAGYHVHPAVLDACLQTLGAALPHAETARIYVPVEVERLRLLRRPDPQRDVWCHATVRIGENGRPAGDVALLDDAGAVALHVDGLTLAPLPSGRADASAGWLHVVRWEEAAPAPGGPATRPAGWVIAGETALLGDALAPPSTGPGGNSVYLAGRAQPEEPGPLGEWLAHAIGGFRDLLRGWVDGPHPPPRVWIVTRGAQAVEPGDRVDPRQAAFWGLGRTVRHEHPELQCTLVDLSEPPTADEIAGLRTMLLEGDREDEVAWRGARRFVPRLTPLRTAGAASPPAFDAPGTHLIAGGLGSLGLAVAEWMSERGARTVVLLGRRPPTAQARAAIERIERHGTRLITVQADVCDEDQLRRVLQDLEREAPPLRGVVHAAGVLDDGLLIQLEMGQLRRVLDPKAVGAWNLHRLTEGRALDYFVMFSSAAGVLGSPGQASYAAASAFLDGLAHLRRSLGRPALSICWGPWSGFGLAARADRAGRLESRGVASVSPEIGLDAFGRLLGVSQAQVGVLRLDPAKWRRWYPQSASASIGRLAETSESEEERGSVRGPLLALPPGRGRVSFLLSEIRSQLGAVLRIPPPELDAGRPLRELGVDSLMAVELRNRLEVRLGLTLPVTLVWRHPTLDSLAHGMLERIEAEEESARTPVATVPDPAPRATEDVGARLAAALAALEEQS